MLLFSPDDYDPVFFQAFSFLFLLDLLPPANLEKSTLSGDRI